MARVADLIELTAKYTDLPTGYRTDGTLVVARDTADKTHLEELREYQSRHGMAVDKLTTREARKLEPALSPALAGAVAVRRGPPRPLRSALKRE